MLGDRLYFDDAYTTTFEARVVAVDNENDAFWVRLENSFFYPSSGGQPCDLGWVRLTNDKADSAEITQAEVKNNQVWLKTTNKALQTDQKLSCQINWQRRFDHMQQHSGQHVFSQALLRQGEFPTVGFHLGDDSVTIDVEGDLGGGVMNSAEILANQIIYENRPIKSYFVPKTELDSIPLRKIPDVDDDHLRIVEITDFDWNACGGTHVRHTGEIGIIKLLGTEKIRNTTRIRFACGNRALQIFNETLTITTTLSNDLTCAPADLPANIAKIRQDFRTANKKIKQTQSDLATLLINDLLTKTETRNNHSIIAHTYNKTPTVPLSTLANQLANRHQTTALLASCGQPATLVFATAKTSGFDMNTLITPALANLEGKGGGSSTFAQGSIPQAKFEQISAEIASAKQRWFDEKATSQ